MVCLRCLLWICFGVIVVQIVSDFIRALRFEFSFQTDFAVAENIYHHVWNHINAEAELFNAEGKVEPSFNLFYSMLKSVRPSFIVHEDYAKFLYRYFTKTI